MTMPLNPPTDIPPSSTPGRNGYLGRCLSVLVVDDEPAFCFAIAEILTLSGHQVQQAFSVSEALGILTGLTPDLILTDIMMPGSDGPQDRDAARRAGADGYLAKPFSAQELQAAISVYTTVDAAAA